MPTRLVLVGAGHAHLAVLDALAREPLDDVETTVVTTDPRQFHPSLLADTVRGTVPFDGITVDVAALARRAGARLKVATATALDRARREIKLGDGTAVRYDVASIATGAGLAGADREGVRTWALMVRPAAEAAALGPALDGVVRRKAGGAIELAVVGGGADAIELALATRTRLETGGGRVRTTILMEEAAPLADHPAPTGAVVAGRLGALGVTIRTGVGVESLDAGMLTLRGGERVAADAVIWAAGPAPLPFARATGLSSDRAGAIQVDAWLRSVDDPLIFAAGPVATTAGTPIDPLRSGAVLAHNLLCVCTGTGPLRRYARPKWPLLLSTGAGRARLAWGAVQLEAGWLGRLRERRARRYLARFTRK
ncbi:MAG TPA: FAD-dependent oxidoreductase [Gemmatimonadales bacterium]|nr:FAD-dependent oxidoreductase [Gemmatimonadales bacterium]